MRRSDLVFAPGGPAVWVENCDLRVLQQANKERWEGEEIKIGDDAGGGWRESVPGCRPEHQHGAFNERLRAPTG